MTMYIAMARLGHGKGFLRYGRSAFRLALILSAQSSTDWGLFISMLRQRFYQKASKTLTVLTEVALEKGIGEDN